MIESPHSKRSLPNTIGFSPSRVYGEDALSLLSKDPSSVIELNQRAVGSPFASTRRLSHEFATSSLLENSRGGISYLIHESTFSAEEILAMQFEFLKSLAAKSAAVQDCVLAIPAFSTQTQRRSLIAVAEALHLQVTSLISANTAAALYYGVERFDAAPVYVIIYNLGTSYVQASLVRYSTAKSKASVLSEKKVEFIEVVAQSWNEEMGGRTIDAFIAEFIAEKFEEMHGEDPRSSSKARARMVLEANKIKKTLSANKSAHSLLPALLGGKDFEITVERSLIEGFVRDKAQEFLGPIGRVLQQAGKNASDVSFLEIIGGVARIPSVQRLIAENYLEVSTHLNGDEAIANGAALFGANFSSQVQIRPVWMNEYCQFSMKAEIKSVKSGSIREKEIFNTKSLLGSVKKVSFGSDEDLEVRISIKYQEKYSEVIRYDIADIELLGQKYMQTPTIVLIFNLDKSGIVKLEQAEARVEIDVESFEDIEDETKNEKDLKKFSKGSEKAKEVESKSEKSKGDTKINDSKTAEPSANPHPEAPANSEAVKPKSTSAANSPQSNSPPAAPAPSSDSPQKNRVATRKPIRLDLTILETYLESPSLLSESSLSSLTHTLSQFASFEAEQKQRVELRNDLESYLYDIQDKLLGPEFQAVLSAVDREGLDSLLASTASWLESSKSSSVPSKSFAEAKQKLEAIVNPALRREKEYMAREEAVLEAYLTLRGLYADMKELNKTKTWIEEDTRQAVFASINETIAWIDARVEEQQGFQDWELPVLKLSVLEAKISGVQRKIEAIRNSSRPGKEGL